MWDAVRAGATATEASRSDGTYTGSKGWSGSVLSRLCRISGPVRCLLFFNFTSCLMNLFKNFLREAHVNHANNLLKFASDAFDSEVGPPEVKTKAC